MKRFVTALSFRARTGLCSTLCRFTEPPVLSFSPAKLRNARRQHPMTECGGGSAKPPRPAGDGKGTILKRLGAFVLIYAFWRSAPVWSWLPLPDVPPSVSSLPPWMLS